MATGIAVALGVGARVGRTWGLALPLHAEASAAQASSAVAVRTLTARNVTTNRTRSAPLPVDEQDERRWEGGCAFPRILPRPGGADFVGARTHP
jgi:hypothetical protein